MGKKTNRHHIVPTSRLSDDVDQDENNVVIWDQTFHRRWHALFANMTLHEIHTFIDAISKPNEVWDSKRLAKFREQLKEES